MKSTNTEQKHAESFILGSALVILAVSSVSVISAEIVETGKAESATNLEIAAVERPAPDALDPVMASFNRDLDHQASSQVPAPTRRAEPVATLIRNELLNQQYNYR